MLIVTEEQLKQLLVNYHGRLVSDENHNKDFEPPVQLTVELNITDIYKNYIKHYQKVQDANFTTFIKWIAIKAMHASACNFRLINGKCYQFDNLPLALCVQTYDARQHALYYLDNVVSATWASFSRQHAYYSLGFMQDDIEIMKNQPIYAIAHQIEFTQASQLTSFNTIGKYPYGNQPWLVFGEQYKKDGKIFLPLHLYYLNATMTQQSAQDFLKQFQQYATLSPSDLAEQIHPQEDEKEKTITDVFEINTTQK